MKRTSCCGLGLEVWACSSIATNNCEAITAMIVCRFATPQCCAGAVYLPSQNPTTFCSLRDACLQCWALLWRFWATRHPIHRHLRCFNWVAPELSRVGLRAQALSLGWVAALARQVSKTYFRSLYLSCSSSYYKALLVSRLEKHWFITVRRIGFMLAPEMIHQGCHQVCFWHHLNFWGLPIHLSA